MEEKGEAYKEPSSQVQIGQAVASAPQTGRRLEYFVQQVLQKHRNHDKS